VITFLLLTYILSCAGALLYFLLRNHLDFANQKFALLSIVFLSLAIPLYFMGTSNNVTEEVLASNHYAYSAATFTDFCPKEDVLDACYMLAQSETEFCNCETIAKENLLMYHSDFWYNVFLFQERAFANILGIGALIMLILLVVRFSYLFGLVYRSSKERIVLSGEEFTILKSDEHTGAGSFQLFNKYIIWQADMDDMSVEERESILYHEIAHIRQRDTWIKIAVNFLQIFWVLNPAFYFIKRELDALSEYLADQFAILKTQCSAKDYAMLLLRMTERETPALAYAFKRGELKDRIKQILDQPSPQRVFWRIPLALGLAVVFALFTHGTQPVIETQVNKLKVYEQMAEKQSATGQNVFCAECLIKECLD